MFPVLINVAENFSQCWVRRTFYCGPPLNIRVGWISKYYTQQRRKSLFKRYGAALQRSMDKRQYYCKPSVLSTQGWKNCHYSGKTCQSWNFCQKIFSQTNDDAMPLELDQMVLKIKIFKSLSHRLSTFKSYNCEWCFFAVWRDVKRVFTVHGRSDVGRNISAAGRASFFTIQKRWEPLIASK